MDGASNAARSEWQGAGKGGVGEVRINKQGSSYVGDWSCSSCGCEWTLDSTDPAPSMIQDQRDGKEYHMPCPSCKKEVYRRVASGNSQQDR